VSAPDIHAIAARHVHGLPHNWQPRIYSARTLDRCLGYELRGSVPIGTYSRGPRKGRPKWPRLAELQRVVITMDEVRQARIRWENETGLCSYCGGSGQQVKSTGISGTTYRECISCDGTGRALHRRAEVEA
jgi:hypothetical protein